MTSLKEGLVAFLAILLIAVGTSLLLLMGPLIMRLVIPAILLSVLGVVPFMLIQRRFVANRWTRTRAEVKSVQTPSIGPLSTITYQYTVSSKLYTVQRAVPNSAFKVGQTIAVWYNPRNPESSFLPLPIGATFAGLILVCAIALIAYLRSL